MATATVEIQKSFTLKLSEDEAAYLAAVMRNYCGAGEEPEEEKLLRQGIFVALSEELHHA